MRPGWEQALEVQTQLLRQIDGPFWKEGTDIWLENRMAHYGREAMLPSAHAFSMAREAVIEAEPIYVTEEMEDLTFTAMETFDPTELVHPQDFFLRNGLALLERQFEAKDANNLGVGWRCVTWRYTELPPEASPESMPIPSLEIILWTDLSVKDEWDVAHPEIQAKAQEVYNAWGWRWAVAHAVLVPLEYMHQHRHMTNEGDPAASWMTFIRVFNKLMQERIVLKTPVRAPRGFRRSAERAGIPEVKDVIVCELRRAAPSGPDWPSRGDGDARYSHRFMVQGHWRNQACGPKLSLRKQRWISPYIKGPDDKPFIDKKRVWVWDR